MARKDNKGRILRKGESERKDGRYVYRYRDRDGAVKSVYGKSRKELRTKEAVIEQSIRDDIAADARHTLNEVYERYIRNRQDLKTSTREAYERTYSRYVRDGFGRRKLADIRYSDMLTFYNELLADGIGIGSVKNVNIILQPVFRLAERDGMIRINPCTGVMAEIKRGRSEKKTEKQALSAAEQTRLLKFLRSSYIYRKWLNLIIVLIGTGLRISELIGLRWADVDFRENLIRIERNCIYRGSAQDGERFYITSPKTASSIREIPMFQEVKDALLRERKRQLQSGKLNRSVLHDEAGKEYRGFIFANRNGEAFTISSVNQALKRMVRACNADERKAAAGEGREPVLIPEISVHELRHTFCTRSYENEMDVKIIQEILGHADIRTTLNTYTKVTKEKKRKVFEELEGRLSL